MIGQLSWRDAPVDRIIAQLASVHLAHKRQSFLPAQVHLAGPHALNAVIVKSKKLNDRRIDFTLLYLVVNAHLQVVAKCCILCTPSSVSPSITVMKTTAPLIICLITLLLGVGPPVAVSADKDKPAKVVVSEEDFPADELEARGRARWMHEAIHGALQVMHRDFFGTGEEGLTLPSQSLEDVFEAMTVSWGVELRWLGVNAVKDNDHKPQDQFEKDAATAIAAGDLEYYAVERGKFRYVGMVLLKNECLKCHVPNRTSLEDRFAGLALTIPMKKTPSSVAKSSNQE